MAEPMTGPAAQPMVAGTRDSDGRPIPEQAAMGLLNYITAHSMDEDYAHVSEQRSDDGAAAPTRRSRVHVPTMLVLAAFGLLVATAGIQTARSEPVRQSSQNSLVAQVKDRRSQLNDSRRELTAMRRSVTGSQEAALEASTRGRSLQAQLDRLGEVTGAAAVTGPGVRIVVDDNPDAASDRQVVLDTDLQVLANGLWASGAEAVSINNQRLTNLGAIRLAGHAVTVNLRSLTRPYVVDAVGDPDQLAARFVDSDGGTWWLNLKAVYGLRFDMTTEESLNVPAAPPLQLRHARPLRGAR